MTMKPAFPSKAVLDRFVAVVGEKNAWRIPEDIKPYLIEQRNLYHGKTALVLRPGSTQEVSMILKLATQTGTPIVPQGGNTGLVGAQQPDISGRAIILSLSRMNQIRSLDHVSNLVTVEAGVVLRTLQESVADAGRFFPLSLGAEGSCQIGGNLSSNAGGTAVLAYGNMRDLCLGLEVVLPTGEIFDDLRRVKKDNTGYDLKDLFVGAEGTLGVITAAVLKLYPRPQGKSVAYAGLKTPTDVLKLLELARKYAGPALTGFELMSRISMEFAIKHIETAHHFLERSHHWYALIDISSSRSPEDARTIMEIILREAYEIDVMQDAVVAQNIGQEKIFWKMREDMSWAQKREGGSIKHDISVPIASIPDFIEEAEKVVLSMIPDARIVCFGHIGDGNLHYNISQAVGADRHAFLARWGEVNHRIHTLVAHYGGSISAEHGIGQLKRDELVAFKSPIALQLMRKIKAVFDPAGIMNPGKMIQ